MSESTPVGESACNERATILHPCTKCRKLGSRKRRTFSCAHNQHIKWRKSVVLQRLKLSVVEYEVASECCEERAEPTARERRRSRAPLHEAAEAQGQASRPRCHTWASMRIVDEQRATASWLIWFNGTSRATTTESKFDQ
mmetsp:Transcript_29400/g.62566  ORF Transcript_29400/g.62566 Transcript_29400/m.62566 type:complete len:140 (+) Transcript_29400:700-1119(+)